MSPEARSAQRSPASDDTVALHGITYRYPGTTAGVADVDLAIRAGELLVCIGPSGCGKTTLLRLVAGFVRADAGTIALLGRDVTQADARSRQCGIVFQSYALFPHMSVRDNVAYPLRVRGVAVAERRARAERMLELVGLGALAGRLPAALSGGQQQRVALARALVFEPSALLLDEPLSALDAATRVQMRDEIRRIQREQGIATLLITHDQDEALSLADRIAVMRDGRLVQVDTPAAIYDRPADAFVATFVGRANVLDGTALEGEGVDTPLGPLATLPHGLARGTRVSLLIRPERIEPLRAGATGDNAVDVAVEQDKFFGATRALVARVGSGRLAIETASRDAVHRVRIPRDAIQFLESPQQGGSS
ncbi:MAG TPA: ABC transporter ATP-binding protein [Casimicrobiaceae bacterium]|nr:ABC transporter ATP-binding protein [Casimicrobiaceae bacterium]